MPARKPKPVTRTKALDVAADLRLVRERVPSSHGLVSVDD
jgi:hypothetical protein